MGLSPRKAVNVTDLTKSDREQIEHLLAMREDELYAAIPAYLPEYRGTLFSPEGQVDTGKEEFHGIQDELRALLCQRWHLCDKIDDPGLEDPVTLVAAIVDALTAQSLGGIPAFVIAVLVVKIGVRAFCHCSD